jgi:hypothetical protein
MHHYSAIGPDGSSACRACSRCHARHAPGSGGGQHLGSRPGPERLSLKILMALPDILDCSMTDLIEPVALAGGRSRGLGLPSDLATLPLWACRGV